MRQKPSERRAPSKEAKPPRRTRGAHGEIDNMSVAPAPGTATDSALQASPRMPTPNSDTIEATDNLLAEAEDAALATLDTVGDLPEGAADASAGATMAHMAEPDHISDPCMQTMSRAQRREAEDELRDMLAALRAQHKAAAPSSPASANLDSINVESTDASP